MNALDLPLPPPENGVPLTLADMERHIYEHLTENMNLEPDTAYEMARRGALYCTTSGIFEEWGFDPDGEVLYVPAAQKMVVWLRV